MVTNPKIEKKKADIARTQAKLDGIKGRLKEQKYELIRLENDEIIAMFRNEVITEDDFAALMRARREAETGGGYDDYSDEISIKQTTQREGKSDALS